MGGRGVRYSGIADGRRDGVGAGRREGGAVGWRVDMVGGRVGGWEGAL
jgi:hypothetical protein